MSIVSILAEDKRLVTYRPRLNEITGSVTATVLLQQIIFHADSVGYRPFYKFRSPCEHKLYRKGDSWTEELGFSPAEFDTARNKIATRVKKGDSKAEALKGETANHLVIYWTDASRVTWYLLNVDLLNRILEKLYTNSRNSNYQESAESPSSEIQDSETIRKLEKQELPLPETTSEIPIEDTEKTLDIPPAEPIDAGTELYWQHLRETEASQKAGRNFADPLEDALVETAIRLFCRGHPPKKKGGTYRDMANVIGKVHINFGLIDKDMREQAPDIVRQAIELFIAEQPKMTVYTFPSFEANYYLYLSRASNGDNASAGDNVARADPARFDEATRMTLERLGYHGDG